MKNQGRQRKEFKGDPLAAFLMQHFCDFAWNWQRPADLEKLGIECAPNEWPIVGNNHLLHAFNLIAIFPDKIDENQELAQLFLDCLKRSPDFVLGLVICMRKKFFKCSPNKRKMLLGDDFEKLTGAAKEARHAWHPNVDQHKIKHDDAWKFCEKRWRDKSGKRKPSKS